MMTKRVGGDYRRRTETATPHRR